MCLQDLHAFEWANGWPLTYTNWGSSEPQIAEDRRAAMLDTSTGLWSMSAKNTSAAFVCLDYSTLGARPPPTLPPSAGGTCPRDWVPIGPYCYSIQVADAMYYSRAFQLCQQQSRSTLVTLGSGGENEAVRLEALNRYSLSFPRPPTVDSRRRIWIG